MKVFLHTLGCEKNTIDSEYAAGLLADRGIGIAGTPEEADAILVNTCGFIADAKQQSIDTILAYAQEKRADQKLVVTGCLSQRYAAELKKALPEVDVFLGVNDYESLPEMLLAGEKGALTTSAPRTYCELPTRKVLGEPWSASIKIAEGCSNACTYCVIPAIRGGYRSRRPEAILSEAEKLAADGCRELVVIAQDVTAYGSDLLAAGGPCAAWFGGREPLPALLRALCRVEGLEWIRLMYCYEDEITDGLIDVIAEEPKICKYIDIPLQHGSDRILKAMHRRSTRASIESTIKKLRKRIPGIVIRTTFIVGFPGETREDLALLEDLVRRMRFDRLGVFAYSKEEGTPAAKLPGQIRRDTKQRRLDRLMRLQQQISLENNGRYVGQTLEVLAEEQEDDGSWLGRTRMDAPEIDNGVIFTSDIPVHPGDLVRVHVDDAFDYDLSGHVI